MIGLRAERRAWRRETATRCEWLGAVRLRPGREVWILDASPGGVELETGVRLLPGGSVELQMVISGVTLAVAGRVLRSRVSALVPRLRYRAAVVFEHPLNVDGSGSSADGYQIPADEGPDDTRPGRRYPPSASAKG